MLVGGDAPCKGVVRPATVDRGDEGTYVRVVVNPRLPDSRLDALYEADGFGGETTMRAKVIRELIDEIRRLRRQLDTTSSIGDDCSFSPE